MYAVYVYATAEDEHNRRDHGHEGDCHRRTEHFGSIGRKFPVFCGRDPPGPEHFRDNQYRRCVRLTPGDSNVVAVSDHCNAGVESRCATTTPNWWHNTRSFSHPGRTGTSPSDPAGKLAARRLRSRRAQAWLPVLWLLVSEARGLTPRAHRRTRARTGWRARPTHRPIRTATETCEFVRRRADRSARWHPRTPLEPSVHDWNPAICGSVHSKAVYHERPFSHVVTDPWRIQETSTCRHLLDQFIHHRRVASRAVQRERCTSFLVEIAHENETGASDDGHRPRERPAAAAPTERAASGA
jgi:hypothetical protein